MQKSKHYKTQSKISEEELALFRNTVNNPSSFKILDKDSIYQGNNHKKHNKFLNYRLITESNHSGSDTLFYNSGVSVKIIKQMQKGQVNLDADIDLHGQTMEQACISLANFIYYHQHKQYLHIIHGKGYNSNDGNSMSKLKTQTYVYLKDHPQVVAFCSTPQHLGGTGAVIAKLKY